MEQILGFTFVKRNHVGVKLKFGKYAGIVGSGCHFLPSCLGYRVACELPVRSAFKMIETRFRTTDQIDVLLRTKVAYHIQKQQIEEIWNKNGDVAVELEYAIATALATLEVDYDGVYTSAVLPTLKVKVEQAMKDIGVIIEDIVITNVSCCVSVDPITN